MSIAQELGDLIYVTALQWVPQGGGIAEVGREGASVIVFGRQPGGLRGVYHAPTCVMAAVGHEAVDVHVVGGRPGIPVGQELFTVLISERPLQEVADETVAGIAKYLADTTS
jgi:hypothetical protein